MKKQFKLMLGDNISSLKKLPDNSVDSIVSDPPYGLSFMNKKWDYDVPSVEFWKEVYRVLKPGGHVLSFGGTRTYHRMVVNIEDAGFEIRDQIMWLYGSGFPKSHNIGKAVDKIEGNEREAVDKIEGNEREVVGSRKCLDMNGGKYNGTESGVSDKDYNYTKGTSPYEGWGTALKPANEPICVARKPLSEKSVAENVLKWGTGGINIDGCRVETSDTYNYKNGPQGNSFSVGKEPDGKRTEPVEMNSEGRFPANIILDETAAEMLDEQSGFLKGDSLNRKPRKGGHRKEYVGTDNNEVKNKVIVDKVFDSGGASRFFYIAKVSKKERNMGLDHFEDREQPQLKSVSRFCSKCNKREDYKCNCNADYIYKEQPGYSKVTKNSHPTVKPVQLMAYLCRLVTPPNGIVLDPFMGSGSTGIAACLEGFRFVGMEMDEDYFKIASARIENYEKYREFIDKKKKK